MKKGVTLLSIKDCTDENELEGGNHLNMEIADHTTYSSKMIILINTVGNARNVDSTFQPFNSIFLFRDSFYFA